MTRKWVTKIIHRAAKIMTKIAIAIATIVIGNVVAKESMTSAAAETTIASAIMNESAEGGTAREKAGAPGLAQEAVKGEEVKRGRIHPLASLMKIGENSDKPKR